MAKAFGGESGLELESDRLDLKARGERVELEVLTKNKYDLRYDIC